MCRIALHFEMPTGNILGVESSCLSDNLPLRCTTGWDIKRRKTVQLSNIPTVGQQLNRRQIAGGSWSGWQRFTAISASFEEFLEPTQYINAFYTISCYVPFNVQACQMTPRTEEPSHNRWQRLKLACPRFVHYDEQIMSLHVYWLFCQMVHQPFQDHTEWTRRLMETVKDNKQYSWCEGKFLTANKRSH